MGFLARAAAHRREPMNRAFDEDFWGELVSKSKAGPAVNLKSALGVSAAFACMGAISTRGCAQVPFKLLQDYQQNGLDRKRVARDHYLYDRITAKPNAWSTAFEFKETLTLHASLGNAYVFKNIVRGKIRELIILEPHRVQAVQDSDWGIVYRVTGRDGAVREFAPEMIWHVRGPSWDGFLGLDVLSLAKEVLGLSLALDASVASLHANGVRPTGVYSVDATLDDDQQKRVTNWLKKQAAAGTGTPLVLDKGAKWFQTAMTSTDAQTREMRQQAIEDTCRFFGILPIVIGYTGEKANTYASAEAMFEAHKVLGLNPWFVRLQDSANVNLLTDDEREKGFHFKFIANGLLKASAKDRGEYYGKALGSGGSPAFMTQDEIRALEDLDPMGGDAAKLPPTNNKAAPPPNPGA